MGNSNEEKKNALRVRSWPERTGSYGFKSNTTDLVRYSHSQKHGRLAVDTSIGSEWV